jgi:hypothetical protein
MGARSQSSALTFVWAENGGICDRLGKDLGLQCHKPYWWIDAAYYERRDEKNFEENDGLHAEAISIALEHENSVSRSHQEMNKLSLIDVPLKVLVTYPKSRSNAETLLSKFAAILMLADHFDDFATKRRHLVVFGQEQDQKINWSFHLFDGKKFVLLDAG